MSHRRWSQSPLSVRGGRIVDAAGRQVTLHGVNYSGRHKQPPHTIGEGPEAFEPLAALGMNVIRLVMVWEAIEPEPGQIDDAYLDRLANLAGWAADAGLHVIVDMHQDIYSRTFGGSGAPAWTIPERIRPSEPVEPELTWFARYANHEGVRTCLGRFWRNEDELQDHFVDAWGAVADRLGGVDGVIGFEPYNEPFPGDIDFGAFELEYLTPFYDRVVAKVRAAAPSWIAFLEGSVLISEQGTGLDLSKVDNAAYIPHFYDKMVHLTQTYGGDDAEMQRVLTTYVNDTARMGVPWLLGEYGVRPDASGAVAYLRDQQRALSARGVGGTCWHYNPTEQDWNLEHLSFVTSGRGETPLVDVLCRPYPKLVAGTVDSWDFDDDTKRFEMKLTPAGGRSVIYLPKRHYPTAAITVDGGTYALEGEHLLVDCDASDTIVTVIVEA